MPLIPQVGTKSRSVRTFVIITYTALILLGTTMVVPFMITVSGSAANDYDYNRFRPIPRYIYSHPDRYMKALVGFFNNYRDWARVMRCYVPGMVENAWSSWEMIGRDIPNADKIAKTHLATPPLARRHWAAIAADYSEFCDDYPLADSMATLRSLDVAELLYERYAKILTARDPAAFAALSRTRKRDAALQLLSETWGIPFTAFYNVTCDPEQNFPMGFQTWFPPGDNPKYQDYLRVKEACKAHLFTPGVKESWLRFLRARNRAYGDADEVFPVLAGITPPDLIPLWREFKATEAPASPVVPFPVRTSWIKYLQGEEVAARLKLPDTAKFDVALYNKLAGTDYQALENTPLPVPDRFPPVMRSLWRSYVENSFPLRLTTLKVTPELEQQFQDALKRNVKNLKVANELLGQNCTDWTQLKLPPTPPLETTAKATNWRNVWRDFAAKVRMEDRSITCSEIAYQQFLLRKYHSLDGVNQAYGWKLKHIEEAFPPFIQAYTLTFERLENRLAFMPVLSNYRIIAEYLLLNARAVPVTLMLIALAILCTLTINPIAAYSMSRFNLRGQDKVILFMLATMAFPAMVSAIPAYLLMRDLGLLNTFFALVLPGAANGMAIFILKGFFDSLPQELFEAAAIDGASEFQIFRIVAMPLIKPILAINALSAFIAAYNGWEWALIICQDQKMWTIAVWLYQASIWWSATPWVVSAGFVIASIPTMIIFVSCQKIILRGIIIPSMK
jgi:ABC-type glycerol-3-phosphate transport system permease component